MSDVSPITSRQRKLILALAVLIVFLDLFVLLRQTVLFKEIDDRTCRTNGILIERVQSDLEQTTVRTFVEALGIPRAQAAVFVARSKDVGRTEIAALAEGCDAGQLAAGVEGS